MSNPGLNVIRYGCLFSIFSGMMTLFVFGFSLYQNLQARYAAPATGLFIIMTLFGVLAVLSGYLGLRGHGTSMIILAALSLPGSWFIGGLMILGGFLIIYRAKRTEWKRKSNELFQVQKELVKKFNGLVDGGKLEEALALAQQSSQQYPTYAEYWQGRAKPLQNLAELMEE